MYKLKLLTVLAIVFSSLVSTALHAFSLDVRGEYENWSSGLGGTSTAFMKGLSGTFDLNHKFALGVGIVTGDYKTDTIAKSNIDRMDTDLTLSYQYQPGISIFAGYQFIQLDYNNSFDNTRSFEDTSHGLGVGVAAYHRLGKRWYAYGGLGLTLIYASSDLENGVKDRGIGYGSGFNGGVLYGINSKTSVATGIKTRLTTLDYKGDSGQWAHNYTRLVVSLTRAF